MVVEEEHLKMAEEASLLGVEGERQTREGAEEQGHRLEEVEVRQGPLRKRAICAHLERA